MSAVWGLHVASLDVVLVLQVGDPSVPPAVHLVTRAVGSVPTRLADAGWQPGTPVARSWGTCWPLDGGPVASRRPVTGR